MAAMLAATQETKPTIESILATITDDLSRSQFDVVTRRLKRRFAQELAWLLCQGFPAVCPRSRPIACYWNSRGGFPESARLIAYSYPWERFQPPLLFRISTLHNIDSLSASSLAILDIDKSKIWARGDFQGWEFTFTPEELPLALEWTYHRIIAAECGGPFPPCDMELCDRWRNRDYLWSEAADDAYAPSEQRRREWKQLEGARR